MHSVIDLEHLTHLGQLILPKLEEQDAAVAKEIKLDLFFLSIMEAFPTSIQSISHIQKSSAKQISVLVLGPTGAGKSTLIGEMLGYNPTLTLKDIGTTGRKKYVLDYQDQRIDLFKRPTIGHGCTQTLSVIGYEAPNNANSEQASFTFIDTGSISGTTSGIRYEMCHTLALGMTLKSLNPPKILMVLSSHHLTYYFGREFIELLERLQWYLYCFCNKTDTFDIVFAINDKIENPLDKINEKSIRESIEDTIYNEIDRLQGKYNDYLSENGPYNLQWFNQINKNLTESSLKIDHTPSEEIDEKNVDCLFSLLRQIRFLTLIVTNIDKHFTHTNFNEKGSIKKNLLDKLLNVSPIPIEKKSDSSHGGIKHLHIFKTVLLATSNYFNELYSQKTPGDEKTTLLTSLFFFETMSKLAEFFVEHMDIKETEKDTLSNFIAQLSQAKMVLERPHSVSDPIVSSGLSEMGIFCQKIAQERCAQSPELVAKIN